MAARGVGGGAMNGARLTLSARGFTLVELLVALALAAVVATALGGALASASTLAGRLGDGADVAQLHSLSSELLRSEIQLAGRGRQDGDGLAFTLDPEDAGGDVVHVRYLAEADRAEPTLIEASFSAGMDGRRRWNLNRRPLGGIRQPWLLRVKGLRVVQGRDEDGTVRERAKLADTNRLVAVQLEVRYVGGESLRFWASTRRAGGTIDADSWATP